MSIPKEPRQQMINMMYLVLTALLALNVSAEILNAFKLVSDGMHTSNTVMESKNNSIMTSFKKSNQEDPKKVGALYADAQKAEKLAQDFVIYVDSLRAEIIEKSGGIHIEEGDTLLNGKKDYNTPTHIMIDGKKGDVLEKRIEDLKTQLSSLSSFTPSEIDAIKAQITLSTDYNKKTAKNLGKKNWVEYNFDHVPVIAVNTILTKFKGDAINSAGFIIEKLFKKTGEKNYSFDALTAMVNANSSYVLDGQEFRAEVFVSAYSSTLKPEVYLGSFKPGIKTKDDKGSVAALADNPLNGGGTKLADDKIVNGRGIITATAAGTGERVTTGAIKVPKPGGGFEWYPFETKYTAAEAAVVVSPDKMNVFYIGVDNPVSISVPGYGSDKISASLTKSGSITPKGSGSYTVKVTAPGETEVVVTAKGDDGKPKSFQPKKFRIKRVPDPIAKVGNSPGGKIPAAQFKVQRGVLAVLENFDFELKFNVVGFEMTYAAKRQDAKVSKGSGPGFTSEMLDQLAKAKPGDTFYLDEIRVQGPDGATRKLPSIVFQLI